MIRPSIALILTFSALVHASAQNFELPAALNAVIENHCADCHDDLDPKGGLDLFSLEWNLDDAHLTERWTISTTILGVSKTEWERISS